jgi:hypothetical protein
MVRVKGLEPPRLAALGPKPSASTNSATPAQFREIKIPSPYTSRLIAKCLEGCERKT